MGGGASKDTSKLGNGNTKKLIAAVVGAVDSDETPPPALQIAWNCQKWNCLPDSGGYLEQDYALMKNMTISLNIYNALSRLRNAKGAQIHSLTESDRKILRVLVDLGLLFNG